MHMKKWNQIAVHIPATLLVLYVSSPVAARETEERAQLTRRSLESGLGVPDVGLLKRLPGPGAESVLQRLVTGFAATQFLSGKFQIKPGDGKLFAASGTARFRVDDDGTRLRYDNRAEVERPTYHKVSVGNRVPHERLVELGLAFIGGPLAEFVKIGPNEAIVPLKSEYEVEGGVDQHGERDEDKVVSATMVFGRVVDGTNVIGGGSKVSVTFANDGGVLAFYVDWPNYERVAQRQQVLGVPEIWERVSALSSMRFDADEVEVKRFECGYFDSGARPRRDKSALIQAACAVHYVGSKNVPVEGQTAEIKSAVVDQIPAGVVVQPDAGWFHAVALLSQGDVCAVSEVSVASTVPSADPEE
jgi:hypothetical protein